LLLWAVAGVSSYGPFISRINVACFTRNAQPRKQPEVEPAPDRCHQGI